jgi:uncharacterized protein YchJ
MTKSISNYWVEICNNVFSAKSPKDLLLARIAAFIHLDDDSVNSRGSAIQFFSSTMQNSEQFLEELENKQAFTKRISYYDEPNIINESTNDNNLYVDYEIRFHMKDHTVCLLKERSYFKKKADQYLFTHKEPLSAHLNNSASHWTKESEETSPNPPLESKL